MTKVKICGLKGEVHLNVALKAGADFIGFVFYPPSPRYVEPERAQILAAQCKGTAQAVALFVDPSDEELQEITKNGNFGMIQLHGDESPQRVQEIKAWTGLPVMKAFRIGSPEDLKAVSAYEDIADWLIFDAKPPKADLPGGTGERFDWTFLQGLNFKKPWMLSGGLTADNVGEALDLLTPDAVDISSGVESVRGQKDPRKIQIFIEAVRSIP